MPNHLKSKASLRSRSRKRNESEAEHEKRLARLDSKKSRQSKYRQEDSAKSPRNSDESPKLVLQDAIRRSGDKPSGVAIERLLEQHAADLASVTLEKKKLRDEADARREGGRVKHDFAVRNELVNHQNSVASMKASILARFSADGTEIVGFSPGPGQAVASKDWYLAYKSGEDTGNIDILTGRRREAPVIEQKRADEHEIVDLFSERGEKQTDHEIIDLFAQRGTVPQWAATIGPKYVIPKDLFCQRGKLESSHLSISLSKERDREMATTGPIFVSAESEQNRQSNLSLKITLVEATEKLLLVGWVDRARREITTAPLSVRFGVREQSAWRDITESAAEFVGCENLERICDPVPFSFPLAWTLRYSLDSLPAAAPVLDICWRCVSSFMKPQARKRLGVLGGVERLAVIEERFHKIVQLELDRGTLVIDGGAA